MQTLPDLVERAFAKAPEAQRIFAVNAATQLQTICTFACCAAYLLGAAKSFGMLFYKVRICFTIWALVPCAILLPFLSSARSLGSWKPLIWINVAVLGFAIGIPLMTMAASSLDTTRSGPLSGEVHAVADIKLGGVLLGFSMMNFAYAPQDVAVEVIGEMQDPSDFPRMYFQLALPYQAMLFLGVGVGGYYFVGDQVQGMISDNIAFGAAFQVTALCNILNMIIVFVMKGVIPARVIHRQISGAGAEHDDSPQAWRGWTISVTILIAASYLMTQLVPFCVDLVDLVGALLLPLLDYILPIAFYLRWLQDSGTKSDRIGLFEKSLLGFYCVMAVVLSIVGSQAAVARILSSWAFYGPPFSCHCENVWDTCACSSAHLGMEYCADVAHDGSSFMASYSQIEWSTLPAHTLSFIGQ